MMVPPEPLSVLFVCTANVSRSPYAHHRMRHLFGDQIVVASAGIPGTDGRRMDPTMEAVLPRVDRSVLEHRSRSLTSEILMESDLVLTMEFAHLARILERWPDASERVFGLRQFVAGLGDVTTGASAVERVAHARERMVPNSIMLDIADPYRRGRAVARQCAEELDELVRRLGVGLGYEPVAEH